MNRPCHPLAAAFFFASTDNSSKTAVTMVDSDLESSCYIPQHITSTVKDTVLHQIGSKLAAVCQQHSVEKKLADQVDASLRELLSTPSRPRTRTESAAAMFRHAASEIYKPFWLRNPFLK